MLKGKKLQEFAKLVLKIGVNLQEGQGLEVVCPVEKREVAHAFTKEAYKLGAKIVNVRWNDEIIDKYTYQYAPIEALKEVPKWLVDSKNYLVEKDFCYVAISAEGPSAFAKVPAEKVSARAIAKSKALKKFSDVVMANGIRWCVVSVPTLAWAKQVFPHSKTPQKDLSTAIEQSMRLDNENPLKAWEEHVNTLQRRANFLNEKRFSFIRFKNGLGTDLKVGLADDHLWTSAKELAKDGVEFVANLPTEEVFTAPHKDRVDGVLVSALPLCENGKVIDKFRIEFKQGKIVDYSAEQGYDALKNIINTDKGTKSLGEIALIGKNSPIAKSGLLFYNTLFDENASCHLAIGKGYPTTIKDGDKLSKAQLEEKGLNDSVEHVDFMIGTPDLSVTGIDSFGNETPLFIDGEWII
ncbi:MAG: aminopeptidase [Clostridia bacterium]|nr:aminopeptidase [Clostridia bacterium]